MENAKKKFADRLRRAMEEKGYPPRAAVLEREFNLRYWGKPMTLHGVGRWLRGEAMPPVEKMQVLAEWLQVPPQELYLGAEVVLRISQKRKQWDEGIGYQERELFEAFLRLPVPQRRLLREVILTFVKANLAEDSEGNKLSL